MTSPGSPAASSIAPVADGDRVHDVSCLDDVAARDLDDERFHAPVA